MFLFLVLMITVLAAIFVQDIKSRSVYWFWFPLLTALFLLVTLNHKTVKVVMVTILWNEGFILLQLSLVSVYFSVKYKQGVNITKELLGWGDVLFLVTIGFYLSVLNYILFYVTSLLTVLLTWGMLQLMFKNRYHHIPLAGIQALLFIVCLIADWCSPAIDLTNDNWLLRYFY